MKLTNLRSSLSRLSMLFLLCLCNNLAHSQIGSNLFGWEIIGDVELILTTTDSNNGDGVNDGALKVNGITVVQGQGVQYKFSGTMQQDSLVSISTYLFNDNASYVSLKIELVNITENRILETINSFTMLGGDPTPVLKSFTYTPDASDHNDELVIRYTRTDDGNLARDFSIDNIVLDGEYINYSTISSCTFAPTPDLPLPTEIYENFEADLDTIVGRFSDEYLGETPATLTELAIADSQYSALNINVINNEISGDLLGNFSEVAFLKIYAKYLKFNPNDDMYKAKFNNVVWLTTKQFCIGELPLDILTYDYSEFAKDTSLMVDVLDANVKELFRYSLYRHMDDFKYFWSPNYDESYQETEQAINTDHIHNLIEVLIAFAKWQDGAHEQYRYMQGLKRYLERFTSFTAGTNDGLKVDGSFFHHWTAYSSYSYTYNSFSKGIYCLINTPFQIDQDSYKRFRDGFVSQYIKTNTEQVQDSIYLSLSGSGRHVKTRHQAFFARELKRSALAGGSILELSTADTIFAGLHNRIYEVDPDFNYSNQAPFYEGFFQYNHSNLGVYRKDNWVAYNKGFSNGLWGSEIYAQQNRYGRYQSYGALEILLPGENTVSAFGYRPDTWDWNYNPGATVIRLPWEKLHAERGRIDEYQQKGFAGSLNFMSKKIGILENSYGTYGMFAMDFQELEGQGFGVTHSSENHNDTFTFKKSNFYFDNIIICLGSDINNDDINNPTITTLFQRLDNTGNSSIINGAAFSSGSSDIDSSSENQWVISNYNIGFYLFQGNDLITIENRIQQNPNSDEVWDGDYSQNPTDTYYIGSINHGNSPIDAMYEYVIIPNTTSSEMAQLHSTYESAKPYTIHQQDHAAHILEYQSKQIFGYAFFEATTNLNYDYIKEVDKACLMMTQYDDQSHSMGLAVSIPDLGLTQRSYEAVQDRIIQITLQGLWHLENSESGVSMISRSLNSTVFEFTLSDGLKKEVNLIHYNNYWTGTVDDDWEKPGNWSLETPDNQDNVYIPSSSLAKISSNINVRSLIIESSSMLTIESGCSLTLSSDIMNLGNIVINSNQTNSGSIIVKGNYINEE